MVGRKSTVKKQLMTILSLVVVLILALGAYFLIPNKDDVDAKGDVKDIRLIDVDSSKITGIQYIEGEEILTLNKKVESKKKEDSTSEEGATSEQKDEETIVETWYAEGISDDIKQEMIKERVNIFALLKAEKIVVEKSDDLGQYALENPSRKIIVTLEDNSKTEILIGDKLITGYELYVKLSNSDKVYAVNEGTIKQLYLKIEDLKDISLKTSNIFLDDVKKIEIDQKDKEKIVMEKTENKWCIKSPYSNKLFAKDASIQGIVSAVTSMSAVNSYDITGELLGDFGLDNPMVKVKITESNNSYKLSFSEAKDGKAYFTIEGSEKIYETSASVLESYSMTAYSLVDSKPFDIEHEDLSKIIIKSTEHGDNTWEILKKSEEQSEDLIEGTSQGSKSLYKLNEEEKNQVYFDSFYNLFKKLTIKKELEQGVTTTEEIISIKLEGKYVVDAKFYEYNKNEDFYILEINENKNFLIEKKAVNESLNMLKD